MGYLEAAEIEAMGATLALCCGGGEGGGGGAATSAPDMTARLRRLDTDGDARISREEFLLAASGGGLDAELLHAFGFGGAEAAGPPGEEEEGEGEDGGGASGRALRAMSSMSRRRPSSGDAGSQETCSFLGDCSLM